MSLFFFAWEMCIIFLDKSRTWFCTDSLPTGLYHPAGRALSSDWLVNSSITVVCEKNIFTLSQ